MYVLLLVVATLPIFAIAFYFGAVSVVQVAEVFAFVLVTACMVGSVSVFFSCLFKRTIVSIVLMYLVIGFLCFGTLVLLAFYYMSYDGLYNGDIPVLATILILLDECPAGDGCDIFAVADDRPDFRNLSVDGNTYMAAASGIRSGGHCSVCTAFCLHHQSGAGKEGTKKEGISHERIFAFTGSPAA